MSQSRRRFPRLKLPEHVESVQVVGFLNVADDLSERIDSLPSTLEVPFSGIPGLKAGAYIDYSARGQRFSMTLMLSKGQAKSGNKEQDDAIIMSVGYFRDRSGLTVKSKLGIAEEEFLLVLESSERVSFVQAQVRYVFEDIDGHDLWFPLPAELTGKEGTNDQFEITGVRGAKLDPSTSGANVYDFTLDSRNGRDIALDLTFPLDTMTTRVGKTATYTSKKWLSDLLPDSVRERT